MGIGSEEGFDDDGPEEGDGACAKRPYQRKSLGCERTYSAKGISDPSELYEKLHKICASVGEDMVGDDLYAKTVTLKLKDTEFTLTTRCATSTAYFQSAEQIEEIARTLLDEALPMKVRLMGVTVSKFRHAEQSGCDPKQRSLLSFLQDEKPAAHAEEGHSSEIVGCKSPEAQQPGSEGEDLEQDQDLLLLGRRGGAHRQFGIEQWLSAGGTQRDSAAASSVDASVDRSSSGSAAGNLCPVCEQRVPGTLMQLNRHLDSCLGICPPPSAAIPSSSSSAVGAVPSFASAFPATPSSTTICESASTALVATSSRAAPAAKANSGNTKAIATGNATGSASSKRVVEKRSSEELTGKRQKGDPLVLSMHDYFAVSRK
jgi:hypothetical protein